MVDQRRPTGQQTVSMSTGIMSVPQLRALRGDRAKIQSGTGTLRGSPRISISRSSFNIQRIQRAFVLVTRSWDFEVVRLPDMDFHQQDTD